MFGRPATQHRNDLTVADTSALETMAAVGAVVAALYFGRTIAIPIAIAILISFSLGPVVTWLGHRGVGRLPSVFLAVAPALLALGAFTYVVLTEVGHLAVHVSDYQSNIEQKFRRIEDSLPSARTLRQGSDFLENLRSQTDRSEAAPPTDERTAQARGGLTRQADGEARPVPVEIESQEPATLNLFRSVLGPLIGPAMGAASVLLFVVFFLAERENLRDRVIRLAGSRDLHRTTMAMDEAGYRVSRYLLLQTVVNALFGVAIGAMLFVIGVPNAALWGGLAAILRFIPYLGMTVAAVPPLALAFAVDPGWGMLVWTGGLFLALEMLTANLVEPWLYGSSTGLSAVALVASAVFWTWLWGPIGLLLATPLTVCIAVLGRYVPQLAFLDVLLGNQAPLKPEESFYQRLLAGDPVEATEQAEEFLKTGGLIEFYDQVALPALELAERDRLRGVLGEDQQKAIAAGMRVVAENLAPEAAKADPAQEPGAPAAPARNSEIVLCIAGRGDLDEAAALLLAQLLELEGFRTVSLPDDSALRATSPDMPAERIKSVCMSYLGSDSAPHARYLGRRLRRRLGGGVSIVATFWGMERQAARTEQARVETLADRVVGSLREAIDAVAAGPVSEETLRAIPEPELAELAARVSQAIA